MTLVLTAALLAAALPTFDALDGDCVGLVSKGDVPWEKNRLWLDLLAGSGTALFVSWKRELMDDEMRAALTEAPGDLFTIGEVILFRHAMSRN